MKASSPGVLRLLISAVIIRPFRSCVQLFNVEDTTRGSSPGRTSPSLKVEQHFQLLGLTKGHCSAEDIRKAYISLAKQYHPDNNSSEEATQQFIEVSKLFNNKLVLFLAIFPVRFLCCCLKCVYRYEKHTNIAQAT